jgi:hypothetical protein
MGSSQIAPFLLNQAYCSLANFDPIVLVLLLTISSCLMYRYCLGLGGALLAVPWRPPGEVNVGPRHIRPLLHPAEPLQPRPRQSLHPGGSGRHVHGPGRTPSVLRGVYRSSCIMLIKQTIVHHNIQFKFTNTAKLFCN